MITQMCCLEMGQHICSLLFVKDYFSPSLVFTMAVTSVELVELM